MSDEQVMITTFTKAYNKYIYEEMVIGQLAHTELKENVRNGVEVDVIMPAMVNLFDYTGGDLPDAELTNTTTAKIKFDTFTYQKTIRKISMDYSFGDTFAYMYYAFNTIEKYNKENNH